MLQSRSYNMMYYFTFSFIIVMFAAHWIIAASTAPITVYVAKKIITLDNSNTEANAVAVKDHKIFAVGSFNSIKAAMKPGSFRVNRQYANDVIMPYQVENNSPGAKQSIT